MRSALSVIAMVVVSAAAAASAAPSERYIVVYRDGGMRSSSNAPNWQDTSATARFAGQPLFGIDGDALLLRDRHVQPVLRPPYVVMANGDVVPGSVVGFELGAARFGNSPALYIAPELPLHGLNGNRLAVRADRVERIVVQGNRLRPERAPQLTLSDGRIFTPRSVRFHPTGITCLTEAGAVSVPFSQISDAQLVADRTQATLEDNLTSIAEPHIRRLTTREGAVLTSSRSFSYLDRPRRRQSVTEPHHRIVLQPSWAFEPLVVAQDSICQSSFRNVNEVPLSLLNAESLAGSGVSGTSFPWQQDRGVRGDLLASRGLMSDFGLGIHAPSALAFELPPHALTLSLWVALDQASGPGGCVVCKIYPDTLGGKPLWESGFLRGSDDPRRVEQASLAGMQRVVLMTDAAHVGRPAGADPFDIRDDVVWLSPLVTINSEELVSPKSLAALLGCEPWEMEPDEIGNVSVSHVWNGQLGQWEPSLRLKPDRQVTFSRRLTIGPASDILEFVTSRPRDGTGHDIELLIEGQRLSSSSHAESSDSEFEMGRWFRGSPRQNMGEPISDRMYHWWDLSAYRGREVAVSFRLKATSAPRYLRYAWGSLNLRSAIANPPIGQELPRPDVLLTSLNPMETSSHKDRGDPTPNSLPTKRNSHITFVGQKYSDGFGMMRNSHIRFAVAPEFGRFVALAGTCVDKSGPLRVLLDGRVAWESTTRDATEGAEWIDLAIPEGTETLTLETGPDGGYEGFSAFANAGFMRRS